MTHPALSYGCLILIDFTVIRSGNLIMTIKTVLLALALTCTAALASDSLKLVSGQVAQRYYPNPNVKIVAHLVIESDGKPYLILDHPNFADIAEGDKVACYAVKGPVFEKTGQRIWYYVSDKEPSDQDKQAAAARIMKRYRTEVTF